MVVIAATDDTDVNIARLRRRRGARDAGQRRRRPARSATSSCRRSSAPVRSPSRSPRRREPGPGEAHQARDRRDLRRPTTPASRCSSTSCAAWPSSTSRPTTSARLLRGDRERRARPDRAARRRRRDRRPHAAGRSRRRRARSRYRAVTGLAAILLTINLGRRTNTMAITAPISIDRDRIAELTARESRQLNDRTAGSGEMYERAHVNLLVSGVASSYQVRDPWPIYLEHGKGPRVWDVDGNEMLDFHNGFGSMVQGHAHPAISARRHGAALAGHALRRADRGRHRRRRGARPPLGPAQVALRQLRLRGDDGRDPHRARLDRARHDHEDLRLLPRPPRLRDGLDRRRRTTRSATARTTPRFPTAPASRKAVSDMTIAVPFNDADAMERRIERLDKEGRKPACVIMEAAMMNLGVVLPEPGYLEAVREITRKSRHRPDLRRGQDRPLHRRRRRDREVQRPARHGHARQGARRRAPVRRDRRHRGGDGRRRGRHRLPGRHLQREPARHGRGARQPARGPDARRLRAPRPCSTTASLAGCQSVVEQLRPARLRGRHRLEGLRHVLDRRRSSTTSRSRRTRTARWPISPGSTT